MPTFFPQSRVKGRPGRSLVLALVLAGATVSSGPPSGPEPYPRSKVGRFEVSGFDFRPDGAWRRTTAGIRAARRALLKARRVGLLNPKSSHLTFGGTFLVPVIPITFQNVAAPFAPAELQQVLFSATPAPSPYSVRTYYREVSRGNVTIDGEVLPWVTGDSTDVYYEDGCNGVGVLNRCPHGGLRFGNLLLEALQRADDGSVDWGRFDDDGPDGLPNSGDDDGVVDFVTFLQPEVDGACGNTNLWSHRYDIAGWNAGSGYFTTSPMRDGAGQPIPGRFIQVRDYILQSAVGGPGACSAGEIMPIGTVAHETGHAFGLPDLYDTDLRNPGVTQGIGEWGLMGSGNYAQPYSPAGYDAWSLLELGWVTVDTVRTGATLVLPPVLGGDTVLYLTVPNTDEYFLFENRQPIGSDTAQLNPACRFGSRSCAKAPGLLVWHIDQGQIDLHGFAQDNRVNTGPIQGVALVQADGLNQLRQPGSSNRGDAGDPWPGSTGNTLLGPETNPASLDNTGATAGFTLDSIAQLAPGGPVRFRITLTPPGQVFVTLTAAANQLVGRRTLGSAQLARLDSLGNRNGGYDTGDFLAFYEQQPVALRSPR